MKLLILAGGSGTRLWPLSRVARPKQVQPFLDQQTLLQRTWARLRRGFSARDIFISTTDGQLKLVREQLPQLRRDNIIVEPVGRNTGPAIGFAAAVLAQLFPREVVATVNSDHHIAQESIFLRTLRQGERTVRARPDHIVLLGLRPTYAETGYGYIEVGSKVSGTGARRVVRFTEKPTLAKAQRYLRTGHYLWNSGLFLFYPTALLGLVRRHAPRLAVGLQGLKLKRQNGYWAAGASYRRLPSVSLDYAVLEKTKQLAVQPCDFGWTDVGHWRSVYDILAKKKGSTVVRGKYLGLSSGGNLVHAPANKLVATIGLHDMVIIDTGDALLVCPLSAAQDVKQLAIKLRRKPELRRYA